MSDLLQDTIKGAEKQANEMRIRWVKELLTEMGYKPNDKFFTNRCKLETQKHKPGVNLITLLVDNAAVIYWTDEINIQTIGDKIEIQVSKPRKL